MKNINSKTSTFNFKTFAKYFFALFSILILGIGGMTIISLGQKTNKEAGAYYSSSVFSNQTSTSTPSAFLPTTGTAVLAKDWAEKLFNTSVSSVGNNPGSSWDEDEFYRHNIKNIVFTKDIVSTLKTHYPHEDSTYSNVDDSRAKLYHYKSVAHSAVTDPDTGAVITPARTTYSFYTHYVVASVGASTSGAVKAYIFYDDVKDKQNSSSSTNGFTVFIASRNQDIQIQGNTFGIQPYTTESGYSFSIDDVRDHYYSYTGFYPGNYPEGMNSSYKHHWFYNLETIDFGSCVKPYTATSYQFLFAGCGKLTTISNYGNLFTTLLTSTHKDLSGMFYYCESLTSIPNISVTASQTSLVSMFEGCSSLTSLNLSSWFVSGVTNFTNIFNNCHALTAFPTGVENWDISSATKLIGMFQDCRGISSFDGLINNSSKNFIAKMKTSADISWMFYDCKNVGTLNLTTLLNHLSNSANVSYLIGGIDPNPSASEFITGLEYFSKFKDVSGLFSNWHNLTPSTIVSLIGALDTTSAEKMNHLFYYCQNLGSSISVVMRLPGLKMKNVTSIYEMFSGCLFTNLNFFQAFITNYSYDGSTLSLRETKTSPITNMSGLFKNCTSLASFADSQLSHAGSRTSFSWKPTNTSSMFYGCSSLTTLDGISILDTSASTSMSSMFYGSGLTSLNEFDQLKFSACTNASYMFAYCNGLTTLTSNASTTNATSVTDVSAMFYHCSNLASIGNFSYFNCSGAKDMQYMFAYTKLANLNGLTSLNMSSATNAYRMFYNCSYLSAVSDNTASGTKATSLTNIKEMFAYSKVASLKNMIKLNLSKVTDASYMFAYCTSLADLTGFSSVALTNTSKNTNASYMFYKCTSLQYVDSDTSGEEVDFSGVKNIEYMFSESKVTKLTNMIKFKTPNVTDASHMFYECNSLNSIAGLCFLPLTSSSGVDASYMFAGCGSSSFTTADFSSGTIDFSGVTTFAHMFDGVGYLSTVKFSASNTFKTDSLTNTSYMFYFTNLSNIENIENFDTDNVTNMSYMLYGCDFVDLDISKLHTDNVTNMYMMFAQNTKMTNITFATGTDDNFTTEKVTLLYYMLYGCNKLTTLDLTSFSTSAVTNINYMFYNCTSLQSVDMSSFQLPVVSSYSNVFNNCTALKEVYAPNSLKSGVSISLPKNLCNEKTGVITNTIDSNHLSTSVSDKTRLAVYATITYTSDDLANVTHSNPSAYCLNANEQTITLTDPERPNYKFAGWTLTSSGDYTYDSDTKTLTIAANCDDAITLSMSWDQDFLTLNAIDKDGIVADAQFGDGSTTQIIVTAYGNTYGTLPEPTSTNYNFLGWWDGNDMATFVSKDDIASTTVTVDGDHTLYAVWEGKPVTVTLNVNGGDALSPSTVTVKYGETWTATTLPTPTRTNHIFLGWFDAITGGTKFEKDGVTVTETADFTLYAQWQISELQVSFDTNGGDPLSDIVTVVYLSTYVNLPTPTRTGYDFDGWYLSNADMSDSSKEILATSTVTQPTSHTLYAKWVAQGFFVFFNSPYADSVGNGLIGSITLAESNRSITFGQEYGAAFPAISLSGYTFDGWYYEDTFATKANNTDIVDSASNKNLYAKLIPDSVSISFERYAFDTDGNALVDAFAFTNQTIATTYGAYISIPAIDNLAGYDFGGWYQDVSDENTKLTTNQINFTGSKTFKTKWTIHQYTITIATNDGSLGSVSTSSITKPYSTTISSSGNNLDIGGTIVTATSATITGYTVSFDGWTSFASPLVSDCTITANFSKTANDIVLSFNANTEDNYGSALLDTPTIATSTLTIKYDDTITNLPTPSFSTSPVGYEFLGWFSESGTQIENGDIMKFETATNIVAHWLIKEYTFSLSTEGEGGTIDKTTISAKYKQTISIDASDDKILTIGTETTTATLEVNAGYDISFLGYFFDGTTKVTSTISINDDTKTNIVAKFSKTARTFKVTFYPADGNFIGSDAGQTAIERNFTYDTTFTTIPVAEKTGYNFIGFYTNDGLIQVAENAPVTITSDIDVFATFSLEMFTVSIVVEGDTYGKINNTTSIQISNIGYGTEALLSSDVLTLTISGTNYVATKFDRDGHTITLEWFANDVNFTASKRHVIVRDTTIKAKFTISADTYVLSYNLNTIDTDGDTLLSAHQTTFADVNIVYGAVYPTLPSPSLEGYKFKRWSLNGNTITSGAMVSETGNQTLLAEWEINVFRVTISVNNAVLGSVNKTSVSDVEFGTQIKVIANTLYVGTNEVVASIKPNNNGYTNSFINFTKDGIENFPFNMPNSAISIVANFERTANTYSVDFDPNGGSYVAGYTVTFDEIYGDYLSTNQPTKDGHSFKGWFLAGQKVTENSTVKTYENHTLVAEWDILTFNISFATNNDGGVLSSTQNLVVDWNTQISVSGNVVTIHTSPAKTVSATAKSIEGYTTEFDGWHLNGTIFRNPVNVTQPINIVAQFKKNSISFIVLFNSKGGTNITQTKDVSYGENYGDLPQPTRYGYNFTGWYSTEDYSTSQIFSTTPLKTTDPTMMLFAKWSPKTINVSFDVNTNDDLGKELHGNPALNGNSSKTYKFTDEYTSLPLPTLTGYTFQHWLSNGQIISNFSTMINENDHTLSAVWVANTYTIIFETNGGSEVESKNIKFNTAYGELADTAKRGHNFLGWFSNVSCSEGSEVTSETILLDETKTTLYAKWETIKYTITFTSNDLDLGYVNVEELKLIPFGSQILANSRWLTILDNQISANVNIRYGYNITFTGWTIENTSISASMVEGDVTIKANFSISPKTVYIYLVVDTKDTFGMKLEGTPTISTPLNFSTAFNTNLYDLVSEPSLSGYTFCGWYLDKQYTKKLQTDTKVDVEEQMMLYAKWEQIIEPINISEILIYVGVGVVAIGILTTVVIILRKQKEKDHFDMGNKL